MADIELYELPTNWIWTTLGEISTNPQYGYTTSASNEARGPKFLRITDLSSGSVNWDDVPYCAEPPDNIDKYLLFEGDIVIARSGSVGKAYLVKNPPEAVFASYLIRFRPILVFDRFVDAFLQTGFYFDQIADSSSGNTIFNVNAQKMRMLNIPLAPLNEQRRIVDEIEAQFSRLDKWLDVMQKLREQLPRLRASILKAAVEGRLVEQEPDDEPAEVLLQRILDERRRRWEEDYLADLEAKGKPAPKDDKWKAKYKEPAPANLDELSDLPNLPKSWIWASLGQLTWQVKDGPHYSPDYAETGIPFISGGNVRPEGVDFENVKFISQELHEELSRRVKPEIGDILYTKGGTTGIARVNTYDTEFSVWVHVAVLKLVDSVRPFYVQHILNSPFCYTQSQKYTHGVGNQDLGLTRMVNIVMPLAPLNEQQRVIEAIDKYISIIGKLENLIEDNMRRAEQMRQAILKQAFEGRLVEQDPNDEPASELLERIQEERQRRAKEETQKPKQQRKPKVNRQTKKQSLYKTLVDAGKPLSPETLFQRSGHDVGSLADVEDFYKELDSEIKASRIRQNASADSLDITLEVIDHAD